MKTPLRFAAALIAPLALSAQSVPTAPAAAAKADTALVRSPFEVTGNPDDSSEATHTNSLTGISTPLSKAPLDARVLTLTIRDEFGVGTATATEPTGPFHHQGRFLGGNSRFVTGDVTIFADTDASTYHLGGRKPDKVHVGGRLPADGLRPASDYVELAGITLKTEAPAFFRRGNKIYFRTSDSSGWAPNATRMFVADRVTGPYHDFVSEKLASRSLS